MHTHRWCLWRRPACTDRDTSFLISQLVNLCQSLAFTFSLNPFNVYSTSSFTESREERHCVLVGIDKNWQRKNFWMQTDCFQADTEHMCPLLVAWPYRNNSRLSKQPPLKLPNLPWVLSHVFSDPLKLAKRGGKEGVSENGRSKWSNQNSDSNVMVDLLQIESAGYEKKKKSSTVWATVK